MQVTFSREKDLMITFSLRDMSQKPVRRKANKDDLKTYNEKYSQFVDQEKAYARFDAAEKKKAEAAAKKAAE